MLQERKPARSEGEARKLPAPIRALGAAVSYLLLCAALLAALVLIVVPLATGSQTYAVLTSSMAPHYGPGTLIVVQPQDFSTLRAGDVVTYQLESGRSGVITHRITGFSSDQQGNRLLITKGDNNDATDPEPVREVQVRGKLLYAIPYAGYLANALGQTDRGAIVNVAAVALIAYGVVTVTKGLAVRGRKAAAAADVEGEGQ